MLSVIVIIFFLFSSQTVQGSPCYMSSPLPSHSSGTRWTTQRRTCTVPLWRTWLRSWLCLCLNTWVCEHRHWQIFVVKVHTDVTWISTLEYQCLLAINAKVHKRRPWWNELNSAECSPSLCCTVQTNFHGSWVVRVEGHYLNVKT